jgi:hypothetical protein
LLTTNLVVLDDATFDGITEIAIVSSQVSCLRASFNKRLIFRARFAEMVLDGSSFAEPSVFASAKDKLLNEDRIPHNGQPSKARILSLRQVDVSTLTLADIDLSACLFQDAHNLDKLRIQGPQTFAYSPAAWRLRVGQRDIPVWQRWSRRQTLAEEHHWRAKQPTSAGPRDRSRLVKPGWHAPNTATPTLVSQRTRQPIQQLQPDSLVVLYRSLRKAEEDTKNEVNIHVVGWAG